MVRVPMHLAYDLNILDQLMTEYTAAAIVCVIDCHALWAFADGYLGVNSARIGELGAFWQNMAAKYKIITTCSLICTTNHP